MFNFLSHKQDDRLKLAKSDAGDEWTVKKGYSILYIGSKDKCKSFMSQAVSY